MAIGVREGRVEFRHVERERKGLRGGERQEFLLFKAQTIFLQPYYLEICKQTNYKKGGKKRR